MKLWVFSDMHLAPGRLPGLRAPEADVAVVAGDVCEGTVAAIEWLAATVRPHMPVVYVAGNHEAYGSALDAEIAEGRRAAASLGIRFLEDDLVRLGGVTFAGATLWTDFALDGAERRLAAMDAAHSGMNDYARIAATRRPSRRPFRPADALHRHQASVSFLATLAAGRPAGPLVILTHHAPSRACLDRRFAGSPLNPAFASDLDGLIRRLDADLWIHGHTHARVDVRVGRTRLVCNPHGYPRENTDFDPSLVIEL